MQTSQNPYCVCAERIPEEGLDVEELDHPQTYHCEGDINIELRTMNMENKNAMEVLRQAITFDESLTTEMQENVVKAVILVFLSIFQIVSANDENTWSGIQWGVEVTHETSEIYAISVDSEHEFSFVFSQYPYVHVLYYGSIRMRLIPDTVDSDL